MIYKKLTSWFIKSYPVGYRIFSTNYPVSSKLPKNSDLSIFAEFTSSSREPPKSAFLTLFGGVPEGVILGGVLGVSFWDTFVHRKHKVEKPPKTEMSKKCLFRGTPFFDENRFIGNMKQNAKNPMYRKWFICPEWESY